MKEGGKERRKRNRLISLHLNFTVKFSRTGPVPQRLSALAHQGCHLDVPHRLAATETAFRVQGGGNP